MSDGYNEKMRKDVKAMEQLSKVRFDSVPYFAMYVKPQNADDAVVLEVLQDKQTAPRFLCVDSACHGCFYYAITARNAYELVVKGYDRQYDDDNILWNRAKFRQMFESCAFMYGSSPEAMAKHWDCIGMQFAGLELPMLPDEERYRFNRTPELRSH